MVPDPIRFELGCQKPIEKLDSCFPGAITSVASMVAMPLYYVTWAKRILAKMVLMDLQWWEKSGGIYQVRICNREKWLQYYWNMWLGQKKVRYVGKNYTISLDISALKHSFVSVIVL